MTATAVKCVQRRSQKEEKLFFLSHKALVVRLVHPFILTLIICNLSEPLIKIHLTIDSVLNEWLVY
jgi:hypothetical protein